VRELDRSLNRMIAVSNAVTHPGAFAARAIVSSPDCCVALSHDLATFSHSSHFRFTVLCQHSGIVTLISGKQVCTWNF
jgi:hypothetical protein